jgi:DNA-binding NarL/FixJ family response regulator
MLCPFEYGRTLLAAGSIRRRAREKRAARDTLEEAHQIFDSLAAILWADRAGDELARISGRRPTANDLTTSEVRLAALAAEGLSNKEIAAALHISVHTVEAHLTRIYRKLGIRSRAALAQRLNTAQVQSAPARASSSARRAGSKSRP